MSKETTTNDPWSKTRSGKPKVGDVIRARYTLTQAHTDVWAEISRDFNPLHFDEAAAKASIFGERIGHGGLVQSVLHGLGATLPGPGSVFLGLEWRFLKHVRLGEEVEGEIEVLEVRDDKPICRIATKVTRSDGQVCLTGTATTYTSRLD